MTGAELATYLSITSNQISRIETGKVKCRLEHIFILCQIFDCSADYLLFGDEEKTYLTDECNLRLREHTKVCVNLQTDVR